MTKRTTKAISTTSTVVFHAIATSIVAVIVALPNIDLTRARMLWHSYSAEGMDVNVSAIALHVAISACVWALAVIGYKLVRLRKPQKRNITRLVRQARGTVMTEFIIVLLPFMLLTSGLAQLAALNVTALLADLAVFQAARVVFVWAPEIDQPRYESSYGDIQIRDRARTIASMALAPTAPNDYYLGRSVTPGSSNYYRRQRAVMVGAFMKDTSPPSWNYEWSGGGAALAPGGAFGLNAPQSEAEHLRFDRAFDTTAMTYRAARKMTQAEWGLYFDFKTICPSSKCDIQNANESGVHFTYWYNLIFPWFGYIWGTYETKGGRTGYYSGIERRHTFPSQPMP